MKLKKLLKESKVWERQFGEKLPTLDDVQKKYDTKLTEGPGYEYKKDIKSIDKSYKQHGKSVLDFYDKLRKKGLDKEASALLDTYKKNIVTFKKTYDKIVDRLM